MTISNTYKNYVSEPINIQSVQVLSEPLLRSIEVQTLLKEIKPLANQAQPRVGYSFSDLGHEQSKTCDLRKSASLPNPTAADQLFEPMLPSAMLNNFLDQSVELVLHHILKSPHAPSQKSLDLLAVHKTFETTIEKVRAALQKPVKPEDFRHQVLEQFKESTASSPVRACWINNPQAVLEVFEKTVSNCPEATLQLGSSP